MMKSVAILGLATLALLVLCTGTAASAEDLGPAIGPDKKIIAFGVNGVDPAHLRKHIAGIEKRWPIDGIIIALYWSNTYATFSGLKEEAQRYGFKNIQHSLGLQMRQKDVIAIFRRNFNPSTIKRDLKGLRNRGLLETHSDGYYVLDKNNQATRITGSRRK